MYINKKRKSNVDKVHTLIIQKRKKNDFQFPIFFFQKNRMSLKYFYTKHKLRFSFCLKFRSTATNRCMMLLNSIEEKKFVYVL